MSNQYLQFIEELWIWRTDGKITTSQEFELLMYFLRQWQSADLDKNEFTIDQEKACEDLGISRRTYYKMKSGLVKTRLLCCKHLRSKNLTYFSIPFTGVPLLKIKPPEKPARKAVKKVARKKPVKCKPPTLEEWLAYASEKGYPANIAEEDYYYWDSMDWRRGKANKPIQKWRAVLSACINRYKNQGGQMEKKQDPADKPPSGWRDIFQILWPGRMLITQWQILDSDDQKKIRDHAKKR